MISCWICKSVIYSISFMIIFNSVWAICVETKRYAYVHVHVGNLKSYGYDYDNENFYNRLHVSYIKYSIKMCFWILDDDF